VPNMEEREGYVPNVVYSCGSIINNGEVVIPYAMSDYASSVMTVSLNALLDKLISEGNADSGIAASKPGKPAWNIVER